MNDVRPIGVFDSGIGGLTVVREMIRYLPNEKIVYFGDTARVPYGTKSAKVVQTFAHQDARLLMRQDVKMIVVACHTASSVALDILINQFPIPILGVIEPGVEAALKKTTHNRIGVIGTRGTVLSQAYEKKLKERREGITVISQACPLFVPLVEEGWIDGDVTRRIASIYLEPFREKNVDTLILGCTHYPLLKPVIQDFFRGDIILIDSAEATAQKVEECLEKKKMRNQSAGRVFRRFYVSDIPYHFMKIGEQCLGQKMESVIHIPLDEIEMEK